MQTTESCRRKRPWLPMIGVFLLSIAGLMTLALVGVAGWLTYVSSSPNATPRPPRLADKPVLVSEPMASDTDLPALVPLPDLSQVDRRLIEPAGLVKPRYCLLVFGQEAKSRVWIIEDRGTIYVDRNGNGDLREAGEAIPHSENPENIQAVGYHEWTYLLGDLTPGGSSEKHTELKLVHYQEGDGPINSIVSVCVGGVTMQHAGWGPLFTEGRDTAPIVHFGGPVLPKPLRSSTLHLNEERPELHFCLGTPGLGKHSFAYIGDESVPENPVVEIAWPSDGAAFKERFLLTQRC